MANLKRGRHVNFRQPAKTNEVVRDFSSMQQREAEADKIKFDKFQVAENLVQNGLNADVRPGTTTIGTISGLLRIGMYETETGNSLYGAIDAGSDTTIALINKTTGATTNKITGVTGQGVGQFTSLNNILYYSNGGADLVEWDGTTDYTVALPSEKPVLCANDEGRIWCTTDANILRFSVKPTTGRVTSFSTSGTAINRGGIANSLITKFTALTSAGKMIIVAGANRIEAHMIPDFARNGVTIFAADVTSLLWSHDSIGVSSQNALQVIGGHVYVKPKDNILYRINAGTGEIKEIRNNKLDFEDYSFDECCLGYDSRSNLLYLGARKTSNNDATWAFNVQEKNWSKYPNIIPKQFVGDEDNVFIISSSGNNIIDAFDPDIVTDDGSAIEWRIRSAKTYAKSLTNFKQAGRIWLNVRIWENINIRYQFFADLGINSIQDPDFDETFSLMAQGNPLDGVLPGFGMGVFGGAGFSYTEETLR